MPTILVLGPYRFFFYAQDRLREPSHVHVQRDHSIAKFWLAPVRLEKTGGFNPAELRAIMRLVEEYQQRLLES